MDMTRHESKTKILIDLYLWTSFDMNPKYKSLLFKERFCLEWTKFKNIQFIVDGWLPFMSLLRLHFKSYIARQTSSIMDRVA